jgi:release factor glutamine methyltransferase
VLEAVKRKPDAATVLDIGTGSGCIAVSLARQLPSATITAVDVSDTALAVARRNAEKNDVVIEFLHGSLFEPVVGRRFDLIVSNPPYIPSRDIETLEPEVRDFDPRRALDGGADGLDFYRSLIPSALKHLNNHGWLLVEIGIGQEQDVKKLLQDSGGYDEPIMTPDPAGIIRVVGGQRK